MTIEEIFKTNPDLLKEPEVESLIKYVADMYAGNYEKLKSQREKHDQILEIIFHSDAFIINGMESQKAMIKIIEII